MVYSDQFVVAVTTGSGIISENNSHSGSAEVALPFGTDYGLRLKNLSNRNAVVSVTIDGEDVLGGDDLYIHGNSTMDLDGFLDGLSVSNKFRFIQKTQEIKDYRGESMDDGLIVVKWRYEKPRITYYGDPTPSKWCGSAPKEIIYFSEQKTMGGIFRDLNEPTLSSQSINCSVDSTNLDGITVKGADTHQSFRTVSAGALESLEHQIVIKLRGQTATEKSSKLVKQVVLTSTKKICSSCGRKSKASIKFCGNCGTRLL